MDESYLSSDFALPEGINRLIKKDEPYNTDRPLILKPSQPTMIERERVKKGGNLLIHMRSTALNGEEDGEPQLNKDSSDDSIENTLNELG